MASRRFAVWASPVAKIGGRRPPNPPGASWRRPLSRAVRSRDGLTPLRGVGLAGRQDRGAAPPKPPRRIVAKAVESCRAFERWPHAASRCGPRRSPRSGGGAPQTPQAHSGEGRWVVPCVREMASRRFAVWASPVAKIRGRRPPNPPGASWRRPLSRAVRSRDGLTPLRGVGLAGRQDRGAAPPKPPRRIVAKAVESCRAFERWPHAASRCGPRRSPRSGGGAPQTPQAHRGEGR